MVYDVYTQLEIEQELEENADYLAHHGRKGQKWGHRNGPPYPLDYKDLSSEEREQAKSEAIRRGDVKEASYNREYYTDDELNKVINRFNLNAKLSDISTEKVMSTWDKIQDVSTKMQTASNAIGNASNLYNNVAKVSNAFLGSNLPVIGEKKGGDNNGGGNKNSNNNQNQNKTENKPDKIEKTYQDGHLVEYKRQNADNTGKEIHYNDEGERTKVTKTRKNLKGNYVTTRRSYNT